ncbi:unnamed protein product [Anisakis simplex]|uniref:EFG_C domain-containing protein n=1 Tax=Anisakis simplex TaxID=6269 RepID=A0A0M3JFT7_ANISI|nr:unnamed protein product [Anisakis simplex]
MNVESGSESGRATGNMIRICARMPLAELSGISGTIRTITSGLGDLHMQLEGYEQVSEKAQALIKSRSKTS